MPPFAENRVGIGLSLVFVLFVASAIVVAFDLKDVVRFGKLVAPLFIASSLAVVVAVEGAAMLFELFRKQRDKQIREAGIQEGRDLEREAWLALLMNRLAVDAQDGRVEPLPLGPSKETREPRGESS